MTIKVSLQTYFSKWSHMYQETLFLNPSHYIGTYIGTISNIQDSIMWCDDINSNPFVGEIVYLNNNVSTKGIVFEISLKKINIPFSLSRFTLKNKRSSLFSTNKTNRRSYCKKHTWLEHLKLRCVHVFKLFKLFLGYSPRINVFCFDVDMWNKSIIDICPTNRKTFFLKKWLYDTARVTDSTILPFGESQCLYFSYDEDDWFEDWYYFIDFQLKEVWFKNKKHLLYCIYYLHELSMCPIEADEFGNYHAILKCDLYVLTETTYFSEIKDCFVSQHKISFSLEQKILDNIVELKQINTQPYRRTKDLLLYNKKHDSNKKTYNNQKRCYPGPFSGVKKIKVSSHIYKLPKKFTNTDLLECFKCNGNATTINKGVSVPTIWGSQIKKILDHNGVWVSSKYSNKEETNELLISTSLNNLDRPSKIKNDFFQLLLNEEESLFTCSSSLYKAIHVISGQPVHLDLLLEFGFLIEPVPKMRLSKESFHSQFSKVKEMLTFKNNTSVLDLSHVEVFDESPVSKLEEQINVDVSTLETNSKYNT